MAAATVEISETNGVMVGGVAGSPAPSTTDGISNINFGSHDGPNLVVSAASYPIVIHATSRSQSFVKWLQFHLVAIGGSSNISNIRVWKPSGPYLAGSNAEVIGSNCNTSSAGITPGPGGNSIIAYATAVLSKGGGAITTPFSTGNPNDLIYTSNWYTYPIYSTLPAFNLSVNGSASSATQLTATGFTGGGGQSHGYSDFAIMILDVDGSMVSQGPVNTKVITFTYDES